MHTYIHTHSPTKIHTFLYQYTHMHMRSHLLILCCYHVYIQALHPRTSCSHVLTHILQRAHLNTAKCHTARRCLFIMKRAVGHIVGTSFFHVNIVRKHLFYPSGIQYSLNRILFYHIMNRYNLQMYSKSVNDQVYYLVGIKKAPNCLDAF
jgi:hypothetical protein